MQLIEAIDLKLQALTLFDKTFNQDIGLYRYGIRVPILRKLVRTFQFPNLSKESILKEWSMVWNESKTYESMNIALYYYQSHNLSKGELKQIFKWVEHCTNWAHSDDLSKIIAQVTEEHPDWTLPTLKRWVNSDNFWKRRQALVGLIEYASKRKRILPFETYIESVLALIKDEEHYVQKAVGWTLREIYNLYPDKTWEFFEEHIAELSAIAFSSSTEKLPKEQKQELKERRKLARKKD